MQLSRQVKTSAGNFSAKHWNIRICERHIAKPVTTLHAAFQQL